MRDRLKVFPRAQIDEIRTRMEPVAKVSWPRLAGCLTVLFTARSGSTYLCRELECRFDVGRMRESLNPPPYSGAPASDLVRERRGQWFGVKAGVPGVIAGELSGFFQAYARKTCFLLLGRRDIVAQAVSRVKADQTGKWHAGDPQHGEAVYDAAQIAANVRRLAESYELLRRYVVASGQPWTGVIYESFAEGAFEEPFAACATCGAPPARDAKRRHSVERVSDEINETWIERFEAEMSSETRDIIAVYRATL